MYTIAPFAPLVLVALQSVQVQAAAQFYFQWPNETYPCQEVPITWTKGVPPFTVWIVPVYGQPFIYQISDSYYQNGQGSTEILLQLGQGVTYTVVMSDANGLATGGSSEIQTVLPSNDTTCLTSAQSQAVSLDFTFTVSGQAVQCERGFETSWSGGLEYGPYNMTAIALDQSFNAFDVTLEDRVTSQSDWVMNIPSGSRFTLMMNSGQGYGRGGVAGIYEAQPGNSSDCIEYDPQPTGTWPSSITIAAMDPPTLPVTQSARDPNAKSGISGGGIAGIVIGVIAACVLVGVILFFLLRRRKRRNSRMAKMDDRPVDLGDSDQDRDRNRNRTGSQAMVEPYRQVGSFRAPEGHSQISPTSEMQSLYSPGETNSATVLTAPRALAATSSADTILGHGHGHGHSQDEALISPYPNDMEGRSGGPGIADPLPSKSPISTPTSTSGQQPSLFHAQTQAQIPNQAQIPGLNQRQASPSPVSAPGTNTNSNDEFSDPTKSSATASSTSTNTYSNHATSPFASSQGQGGMRVVNHDSPESLPTLPPGATHAHNHGQRRRAPQDAQPTFRRHADAGRYEEQVVDLPPLYTEVPRDTPRNLSPRDDSNEDR